MKKTMKKSMKKTMKNMLSMAAAVLTATIMTACAGSDELTDTPQQPENQSKTITLTTTVGLGGDAADDAGAEASGASAGTRGGATRALTSGGVKTFAVGEKMALVYTNTSGQTVKAVSDELTDGDIETSDDPDKNKKSATFTFRLTEEPNKSQPVKYIYPAAMATNSNVNYNRLYSQQDGTLTKLASNFDLATANDLDWVNGNLPGAELTNQLAILAITLKDYSGSNIITGGLNEVAVSAVTSEGTNTYTVTPTGSTFGQEVIYVAILPAAGATIKVTATDGTKNYIKTLTGKDYEINNGYNVSWLMTEATPLSNTTPLTVEALTDGTIVVNKTRSGMKYSVNGGAKAAVTSDAIDVSKGDKVQFYGKSIISYNGTNIAGGTAEVKVYGNIMSLLNETGYASKTKLLSDYTFSNLFKGNDKLKDASGLLLPATTLAQYCYVGMFNGCTGLTAAPALPATMLAGSCYYGMFSGCTSLTTAPALPATKLADNCYQGMFYGCSSLTTAPALPATTLKHYCYVSMFKDCTGLTTAPALPAEKLTVYCYMEMFSGCTSLTTAPVLPATTLADNCYQGMFDGCTSLETAPALPATTLALSCYRDMFCGCTSLSAAPVLPAKTLTQECYQQMFEGCTKLSAVTCLATNISAGNCTFNWLKDAGTAVTGTKTFTTPSKTNWSIKTGSSGIPYSWKRVSYLADAQ